jgi:hypothetical protein
MKSLVSIPVSVWVLMPGSPFAPARPPSRRRVATDAVFHSSRH